MIVHGGYSFYGQPLGILLLDGKIPRISGDIGNAWTFPYPVRYKVIQNVEFHNVSAGLTQEELEKFCKAASELEKEGCRAITTSCGFLGAYQKEISSAVRIPVITSALMQIPWILSTLSVNKKVGVISSNQSNINDRLLNSLGIKREDIIVTGLDGSPSFASMHGKNPSFDPEALCKEALSASEVFMQNRDEIGAIVLECTNLVPYSKAIQDYTELPVFDIITLSNFICSSVCHHDYSNNIAFSR